MPEIHLFGLSLESFIECLQFFAQSFDPATGPSPVELRITALEDGLQMLWVQRRPVVAARAALTWRGRVAKAPRALSSSMHTDAMRTTCKLRTYDPDDTVDFMDAFRMQPLVSKVIMQVRCPGREHASTRARVYETGPSAGVGEVVRVRKTPQARWLKAAFDDMDSSSETVHLLISPAAPYLRLSTAGASGSSEVLGA